jgi:hypothetical protein
MRELKVEDMGMTKTGKKEKRKVGYPDTSEAREWLDADRFKVKGSKTIYRVVGLKVQKEG